MRQTYQLLAKKFGVHWKGRDYDPESWDVSDLPNRCLSAATACLYGVTEAASQPRGNAEREVRLACRDMFRQTRLLDRIIPDIEAILAAGEVAPTQEPQGVVGPAIPNQEGMGDAGHRA